MKHTTDNRQPSTVNGFFKQKKCGLFPTSFFRSLVLLSLAAVLALPIYTIFFLSPSFVDYITALNENKAARVAAHMESKLIPDKSQRLSKSILTADVLKKIETTSQDFNLMKVRILFPSGEILYSTEHAEIGNTLNLDRITPMLRKGVSYTNHVNKGAMDLEGDVMPADTVETYVPIMRDNVLIGGFEIYYDITEDRRRLESLLRMSYFTLFPIVLILFVSVILSCRRANKNINKRIEAEEKLFQQSTELKEKNDELTELFVICRERKNMLEVEQKARQEAQEQVHAEQAKREQLRMEFLRHTVQAQEEERSRIARELHDETAQTLTAASLNFASLKNQLADNPEVADVVDRLQNLCKQMNQDLYRLVHDLRPAQLDDLGLVPALRYLVDEGQSGTGLDVSLDVKGNPQRLDPFVETVIFRIVQEALTNITRYAGVDHAVVQLVFEKELVVILRIIDEGKGFETEMLQNGRKGWGLAGMAERVESIGGTLRIDSSPGKGTLIEVVIPVMQQTSFCPMPGVV